MRRTGEPGGIVFVLSAPSGTGKTTLSRRLIRQVPGLRFSVSYTTRAPRRGERSGWDYHFVSRDRFEALRKKKEFLEWARVDGRYYGTSRRQVVRALARGEDLLLDLDTQGAAQVRRRLRDAVLVFLLPPAPSALKQRLLRRGTDREAMARRLDLARREVGRCRAYDYLVVNDRLDHAYRSLQAIIQAERCRTGRQRLRAERILRRFRHEPSRSKPRPARA